MGFNINNNFNMPNNIQIKKSGDGHAGNSGYCPQKKKKDESEEEDKFERSIFKEYEDEDFIEENEETLGKKIFSNMKKLFGNK